MVNSALNIIAIVFGINTELYGSKYNSESPWNKYSTSGPVIVDNEGNFYGKFTTNKYDNQTRIKSLLWILENHEYIIENINDVIDKM